MKTKSTPFLLLLFLCFLPGFTFNGPSTTMSRTVHTVDPDGTGDPRDCLQGTKIKCGEIRRFTEQYVITPSSTPFSIDQIDVFVQNPSGQSLQVSNIRLEVVDPVLEPHFNSQYYFPFGFNLPATISPSWESPTGKVYINVIFDVLFCNGSGNIPLGNYNFDLRISGNTDLTSNSGGSTDSDGSDDSGNSSEEEETILIVGEFEEVPLDPEAGPFVLEDNFGMVATLEICGYPNPPLIPPAGTARNSFQAISGNFNIKLYPNPADVQAILEVDSGYEDKIEIKVLDLQGRRIKTISRKLNIGTNNIKLGVSDLSPGIYLIQVKGTQVQQSLKLFKN